MKKNSRFAGFYMGLIFFLMYLPIAVVIVFSFNESKLPVKFTGFSLKWYQELFHDRAMLEALVNSLILGVLSCLVSAVIGTLGAVGLSRIHWKSKGALEYISILPLMIPEIILGMVLMAFFYMLNLSYGILCALYSDGSEGKTGRHGSGAGRGSQRSGGRTFPGFPGYYAAFNYAGGNFRFAACVCHVYG